MLKTRGFGERDEYNANGKSEIAEKSAAVGHITVGSANTEDDLARLAPSRPSGIIIGGNHSEGTQFDSSQLSAQSSSLDLLPAADTPLEVAALSTHDAGWIGRGQIISDEEEAGPVENGFREADLRKAGDELSLKISTMHLLVVDDDDPVRNACCEIARGMGFLVHAADSVLSARNMLKQQPVDLMLLDLKLPGGGGLVLLEEAKAAHPELVVVVMTAYATVSSAVEAMRVGAVDYLTKPFALEELTAMLVRASQQRQSDLESRLLRERLRTQKGDGQLIGNSPEMEKLYRILSKVVFTTHPVLILGESGTGKEMVARTIHFNGPNARKPFIPVDCSSLVPTLIESELFGHVKGAFTGANRSKEGLLAAAAGGTVFLDEIGELPLDLQSKLLRALQEKEVRPVGATHSVPVSARILAATNCDLATMVAQGKFRKDLYFRLNVVNLKIPPLRDRHDDILVLAQHYLDRKQREAGKQFFFSDDALRLIAEYPWPGNVRELVNAVERACAVVSGSLVLISDLPSALQEFWKQAQQNLIDQRQLATSSQQPLLNDTALTQLETRERIISIAELEKQAILSTIRQLNGDKLLAAKMLDIGKTTLYRKLKEYGLGETVDEAN